MVDESRQVNDKINEPVNEGIHVEISRDRMLGVIYFTEPENEGRKLTFDEVRRAIEEKGIVKGIVEEDLKEIFENHNYGYKYIIAQGKQPVNGEDGRIDFAFNVQELKQFKPKVNSDGTVDLKDLSIVKNVTKGERLATRILGTPGEEGFNVLGQVIKPKRGREARMPRGRNTSILEDGLTLVADIDGKLEYDDHNIYVNAVYTVFGDLDSSIGNIDFVGSVVVSGSIHSGFSIKAGGTVEVRGPVDDAVIIAGGDIILSYGIQGTEKSKLVSKGNVIAKFIQNAHVEAGGNVITEAILHSTVTAGDSIRVEMGKGTIVGGSVAATNMVSARSIGSPMGTVTAVQIGVPPGVYGEHKLLAEELKVKKENLNKVDQSIKYLITKNHSGQLTMEQKAMLEKFNATRHPILEEYEQVKDRYDQLNEILNNVKDGLIKCSDTVYPGVKVTFGSVIKYIDESYVRVLIRKVEGEIYIGV